MPPTGNNINEASHELTHWKQSELFQVLYFLNNNFDKWYYDNYNLCVKAKEVTKVNWDAQSIYNKVHSLFKNMDDYLKTGVKSTTCTIIWDNNEIYELVFEIHSKTKKRLEEDNQGIARGHNSNGRNENTLKYGGEFNTSQTIIEARMDRPSSIEEIINLCDEKSDEVNNSAAKSIEKIKGSCNERIDQINQYRYELIRKINETNKQIDETNRQIHETNKMYEEFRKF